MRGVRPRHVDRGRSGQGGSLIRVLDSDTVAGRVLPASSTTRFVVPLMLFSVTAAARPWAPLAGSPPMVTESTLAASFVKVSVTGVSRSEGDGVVLVAGIRGNRGDGPVWAGHRVRAAAGPAGGDRPGTRVIVSPVSVPV